MKNRRILFEIDYPTEKAKFLRKYSLNNFYSLPRCQQGTARRDWRSAVISAMKAYRVRKDPLNKPYEVTILWDDHLDIDNHAVLAAIIVNAMKGWVIVDDDRKRFVCVTHRFWRGGCIRVCVEEV